MPLTLTLQQRAALHLALAGGFGPNAFGKLKPLAQDPLGILTADPDPVKALLAGTQFVAWERARSAFRAGEDGVIQGCADLMAQGARLLIRGEKDYPERLLTLSDPPNVLFCSGQNALDALAQPCAAIVGSREATPYGLRMANLLGRVLGKAGVTVVSGAARGIDQAAHEACLAVGGRTVAVLGTVLGGSEGSRPLRELMLERGGSLTEMLPGMDQNKGSFPQRNRLISGLGRAVIVVEGADGSGTRHTAEAAKKQGRLILAVPGEMDAVNSHTPHALISEGTAKILMQPQDVLDAMGVGGDALGSAAWRDAGSVAQVQDWESRVDEHLRPIFRALSGRAKLVDEVADEARVAAAEAARGLLELELNGLVRREPGGAYLRA